MGDTFHEFGTLALTSHSMRGGHAVQVTVGRDFVTLDERATRALMVKLHDWLLAHRSAETAAGWQKIVDALSEFSDGEVEREECAKRVERVTDSDRVAQEAASTLSAWLRRTAVDSRLNFADAVRRVGRDRVR